MEPNRSADPFDIEDEPEVSQDEREQILGQIDKVIESVRRPLGDDLSNVRPRKRGGLFPSIVNAAAAALVVAGGFLLAGFFKVRNESITLRSAGFVSAEGGLLKTLRQESEGLIREKEAEIVSIEQRLELMDKQTAELEARLESDLKFREEELRRRVEAELAAERERLRASGTSGSAIEQRLRDFERQREAEMQSELVRFREELELALREKEQELSDSRGELQSALQALNSERTRLEAERAAREAELRTQFQREREALRQEASAAEQRLAILQDARQQEQLLEDQLDSYYREALDSLERGDLAAAGEALSRLKRLVDSPAMSRVPALLERRSLNRALVEALDELLGLRSVPPSPASAEPPASPAAAAGQAASAMPPGGASAQAEEIEALRREIDTLEKTIEGLRTAARQRSVAASASTREQIATLELQVARLSADLQVTAEDKARLERWQSNVDALSGRYGEVRPRVRRYITQGGEDGLREAQRLLAQTLRDPAATAIFPGMADSLDEIDRSLAAAKQYSGEMRGREAALMDILRYLNYLSRGTGGREAEAQVMAKAREDPLYRAVIRELQILRAGASGAGEMVSPYLLLGTVVSVSGSQIVIEPLGGQQAAIGATVQVRRSDALEQETLIARGTVQQVRGGKVYARIEAILAAGQVSQNRDLVYIEPR
jgi:hypothetical protein